MPEDKQSRPTLLVVLGLLLLGLLVFARVRTFGFSSYDDTVYVSENPVIGAGITWAGVKEVTLRGQHLLWTPLTSLSYMIGVEIYGLNPAGHHLTNLALHLLGAVLLFFTLRRLTGAFWASAFVAAVFTVHPLNVEPVAWVSGRKEQLFVIFWLLSLLAYQRYTERITIRSYLLVLLCHLAGLASKPTHLMLPMVLLLLDLWPLRRVDTPSIKGFIRCISLLVLEKLPLLMLSLAVTWWTFTTVEDAGGLRDLSAVPLAERIPNTIWVYGWYLKQTLLPGNLTVHYPYPETPFSGLLIRGILMGLVFLSLVSITYIKRFPVIIVGWCWFLLVLFPTSGLLRANSFLMADRYAYVPMIGLLIMLAWGVPLLLGRFVRAKWLSGVLGVVFLLSLLPNAYRQTTYWKNDITLFSHAVEVIPESPVAHNSLGLALRRADRLAEAEEQFLLAINTPGPFRILPHMNLGTLYASLGKLEAAEEHFETVVNGNPGYAPGYTFLGRVLLDQAARGALPADAARTLRERAHLALATALTLDPLQGGAGQILRALPEAQHPSPAEIALGLAQRYEHVGQDAESGRYYEKAVAEMPEDVHALRRMAALFAQRGKFTLAQEVFSRALTVDPTDLTTILELGKILAMDGQPEESLAVYERALAHHPDDAVLLVRTATARESLGQLDAARETYDAALQANPDNEAARYGRYRLNASSQTLPPISLDTTHPHLSGS